MTTVVPSVVPPLAQAIDHTLNANQQAPTQNNAPTSVSTWHMVSAALAMQGCDLSADTLSAGLPAIDPISPELVVRSLRGHDCVAELRNYELKQLHALLCPAILWGHDGQVIILVSPVSKKVKKKLKSGISDELVDVMMPHLGTQLVQVSAQELQEQYSGRCVLFKAKSQSKDRKPVWLHNDKQHWLWGTLLQHKRAYFEASMATVMINSLALVGTFYTMTVYDRVIPNNAFATLWMLTIGVCVGQIFEFLARWARAHLVDEVSKKTDLSLGMRIFSRAMSIRLENAPESTGTYANMLREYETVRDFFTSMTLTLLADLPFVLLFLLP